MQQNANTNFPRKLFKKERDWLFTALPENKVGYKQYRELIDQLYVVGYGRFEEGNFILAEEDDMIDPEISSAPIFAIANISYKNASVYVTIHEELNGQVEIDIKAVSGELIPDEFNKAQVWTYSTWMPGERAPHDNSLVREVHLIKNEIVLAIAPVHKKMWIFNSKSGINHFVPVTNYYNEIMLLMNNKEPEIALQPGRLFTNLKEFSDEQLAQGFLVYNKHWNRVELDYSLFEKKQ